MAIVSALDIAYTINSSLQDLQRKAVGLHIVTDWLYLFDLLGRFKFKREKNLW